MASESVSGHSIRICERHRQGGSALGGGAGDIAAMKYRDSISATSRIVEHSRGAAQRSVPEVCPSACMGASIGAARAYQPSVSVLVQDGCAHRTGARVDAVRIDVVHCRLGRALWQQRGFWASSTSRNMRTFEATVLGNLNLPVRATRSRASRLPPRPACPLWPPLTYSGRDAQAGTVRYSRLVQIARKTRGRSAACPPTPVPGLSSGARPAGTST